MKENIDDTTCIIKLALNNAKKRIKILGNLEKQCLIDEYKEWLKDDLDYHSVLLLREDPII